MALGTLAAVGVVNALTAASFLSVAVHLYRRDIAEPQRLAVRAAATWWGCMGLLIAIEALLTFVAVAGFTSIAASTVQRYSNGLLLGTGAWGLCYHVLYLHTGRTAWAGRIAPLFGLVALLYCIAVTLHPTVAVEPVGFELQATHDPPLDGDPLWTAVLALTGLPLIAASISYLVLVRRLERRDQKRRAVLASTGILVWVSAGLGSQLAGGELADFLTITVLGVVAAIMVYLAYFPPHALRRDDKAGPYLELGSRATPAPARYER